jgi:hypothetical protein
MCCCCEWPPTVAVVAVAVVVAVVVVVAVAVAVVAVAVGMVSRSPLLLALQSRRSTEVFSRPECERWEAQQAVHNVTITVINISAVKQKRKKTKNPPISDDASWLGPKCRVSENL